MKKLGLINPRQVNEADILEYRLREAVRAIVFDNAKNIALLEVSRDSYFKLPGGGVESGEDFETALKRECLEEIGCDIKIIKPIGYTEEYWKEDTEKQVSYCYLAKLDGEKGEPELIQSEKDRGFETIWVSLEEGIEMLESCSPTQWEGDYIPPRELLFLRETLLTNS